MQTEADRSQKLCNQKQVYNTIHTTQQKHTKLTTKHYQNSKQANQLVSPEKTRINIKH